MKRYITLVIGLLISISAFSQKYKDVYEAIIKMSDNEAYQELQEFSKQRNNSHSASLYKMAQIIERRLNTYDPFLQERALNQNIYNAELYLGLAKLNLTEKVARQDARFFDDVVAANPKKDPSFLEIADSIDHHLKKVAAFKKVFTENRNNLYNAATKYNECIRIYNEINQKNSKLRDLYFLVDDNMKQKLKDLKTNFDSTLYYLETLQKSLKKRPMHKYTFEYQLNPILVYRMHGLTPSNFLAPVVELWDFNLWIKTFNDMYTNEISYLYKNIDETDTKNRKYVGMLEKKEIDGVPADYRVSPYLINKIYKYDYESLANQLLIYQESQVRYMYQLASYRPDTSFFAFGVNYPSVTHFTRALECRHIADSLLTLFGKSISDEGIRKYSSIFEKKYNGEKGLKKYVEEQQTYNNQAFDNAVNEYANRLLTMGSWKSGNVVKLLYNTDTVYARIVPAENIPGKGYFVHCKYDADNNQELISGTYVDKKGDRSAFVASVDTLRKITWIKTFKQGDGSRTCRFVASANDEVVAVVTSTTKAGAIRNFMVLMDKSGNQKLVAEVKGKALPRKLIIDDIGNKYIVLFSGTQLKPFVSEENEMHICCFDSKLKTLWDKQLKFKGYVCNILRTDNVYYVIGAYSKMINLSNANVSLDNGLGLFIYTIDGEGKWLKGENYEPTQPLYPMWVSKCDNTTFEVVSALKSEPRQATSAGDAPKVIAAYMRFTFGGDEIFSSIDK